MPAAMSVANMFDSILVDEAVNTMGAMNDNSSSPNSSTSVATPLGLNNVEEINDTADPFKDYFTSPNINNPPGCPERRYEDLTPVADNSSQRKGHLQNPQTSVSCHGRSVMPAPTYFGHNPNVLVCFPNSTSVRIPFKDARTVAENYERVRIINFIQEPAYHSVTKITVTKVKQQNAALNVQEMVDGCTDAAIEEHPISSTVLRSEDQSTEGTATHSFTTGASNPTCRVCLSTFPTKSQMFRHIRRDHRGFKNGVMNGNEELSSSTTSGMIRSKDEEEIKQELGTVGALLTKDEEMDVMREHTGKSFQDAMRFIRPFAAGQKLVAEHFLANRHFVTDFEQRDLQWSVANAEELANIGRRLDDWVREMVQNGLEPRAQQEGQAVRGARGRNKEGFSDREGEETGGRAIGTGIED